MFLHQRFQRTYRITFYLGNVLGFIRFNKAANRLHQRSQGMAFIIPHFINKAVEEVDQVFVVFLIMGQGKNRLFPGRAEEAGAEKPHQDPLSIRALLSADI